MTDPAAQSLHNDPSGFVNQMLSDAQKNGVDVYLDNLDGPTEDDLEVMEAMNDLENEELE